MTTNQAKVMEDLALYATLNQDCALASRDKREGFESSCTDECDKCDVYTHMAKLEQEILAFVN